MPHLMWRLDQQWRQIRSEVPWMKRLPSDVIRDHIRFATQPMEEMKGTEFSRIIDQMGSEDLLVFSTDYPHWDFDSPKTSLPRGIDKDLRHKILVDNALATYDKIPTEPAAARGE